MKMMRTRSDIMINNTASSGLKSTRVSLVVNSGSHSRSRLVVLIHALIITDFIGSREGSGALQNLGY